MTHIIFWLILFIIFYTYLGYIGISILLAKVFGKKPVTMDFFPKISIIIPCYNEEKIIRQKIENTLSLEYPKEKLEIIIASESTDSTNSIVSEFKNSGVKLYAYDERIGKTGLLYRAVPEAIGEIVVFSDANALYKKDAVIKIARNFYDNRVGAVVGRLIINNLEASSISKGEYIYKKYEMLLRESNGLLGRVLNADGSIFAIRKTLYMPISPERGDDFELIIRILISGYKSLFEPEAISYEEASVTSRAEYARKVRMVSWFLKSSMLLLKEMLLKLRLDLMFQIISHKLLRWFSPYFFIAFFITNIMLLKDAPIYSFFLIIQIFFYLGGLIGFYMTGVKKKKAPFLLGAIQYFIVFNYAFMIGVLKSFFLRKTLTPNWEKVRR